MNNLRQMAIACQHHALDLDILPDAGDSWANLVRSKSATGMPLMAPKQNWGWMYQILPYIEGDVTWMFIGDDFAAQTTTKIYFCPSRRSPIALAGYAEPLPIHAQNDYVGNAGTRLNDDTASATGVICRRYQTNPPLGLLPSLRMSDIPDGLSNTFLLGEKLMQPAFYERHAAAENVGYFSGFGRDCVRWANVSANPIASIIARDSQQDPSQGPLESRFGSIHPGGVNMAFCDGSVRNISYAVSTQVFCAGANRKDGQAITFDE
jgi:prepilin-type processing-associated H-X9-DG protein